MLSKFPFVNEEVYQVCIVSMTHRYAPIAKTHAALLHVENNHNVKTMPITMGMGSIGAQQT